MKHGIDAGERAPDGVGVSDIATDELGCAVKIGWPPDPAIAVDLRQKIVEDANLPAFPHEQIGDMRTDQPCAAGDKSAL